MLKVVDEADCRTLCLQEEECVAVEYNPRSGFFGNTRWCEFLDTKRALRVRKSQTGKLVVFLPRLQREKKDFLLTQTKIKSKNPPRKSVKTSNVQNCSAECTQDAFCRAFVMCDVRPNSWCESTSGNCYLYSEAGIDTVEPDVNSEVHFVWKNYTQVNNL